MGYSFLFLVYFWTSPNHAKLNRIAVLKYSTWPVIPALTQKDGKNSSKSSICNLKVITRAILLWIKKLSRPVWFVGAVSHGFSRHVMSLVSDFFLYIQTRLKTRENCQIKSVVRSFMVYHSNAYALFKLSCTGNTILDPRAFAIVTPSVMHKREVLWGRHCGNNIS